MTPKRETLHLPEPKQDDKVNTQPEKKPAHPAPQGITHPQPLEPPCLDKSHSHSSSS